MTEKLYNDALACYDRDDFASAAAAFERLLLEHPDHVEARYKLGNARKELGEWAAAASHYERVLQLDPAHGEAFNNLGAAHESLGRAGEAERCYRQALQLRPSLAQPCINLGRLLQGQGRAAEAAGLYRAALGRGLDPGVFGHLLRAASGGDEDKAPEAYVRETFDAFASQFDRHLTEALDYRVPARLAELATQAIGNEVGDVLDLGCGTGLMGEALVSGARRLVGIDLSPRMLELARRRGVYHELHAAEIEQWLAAALPASFDLVAAADVFIYIGRLEAVFAEVARILRPGGCFALSVESCEQGDWLLQPSGRYAHSSSYIARLAQLSGLRLRSSEHTTIRRGIAGEIHVAVRSGRAEARADVHDAL